MSSNGMEMFEGRFMSFRWEIH